MTNYYRLYWTLDKCIESALKYETKLEWATQEGGAYKSALKHRWIDRCCSHMRNAKKGCNRKYTKDQCIAIANTFKSREEWKKQHNSSYKTAALAGWYYDCVKDIPKLKGIWTRKNCIKDAKKYSSISDWRSQSPSAYTAASKKGYLNYCTTHMKKLGGTSKMEKELAAFVESQAQAVRGKRFITKGLPFSCFELDIYVPSLNKAIEFDGKYWHSLDGLKRSHPNKCETVLQNYHQIKDNFFKSIGIEILHISENEWQKNKEQQLSNVRKFLG